VRALLVRFACTGVLYDIGVLKACLERNLRQITFLEAYHLTRRVLNVTVSCAGPHEMPRLLNYLTAPNVIIASAVAASCSAPGLFGGSELLSKDRRGVISEWSMQGTEWIDGSVENDLPMDRLAEQFNVNHFIVCQVGPARGGLDCDGLMYILMLHCTALHCIFLRSTPMSTPSSIGHRGHLLQGGLDG
jgi:predicted acylesterase/phospholipase RssA